MHAQTKYKSEMKTAVLGDRTITIKNLTPILPPQEREKRRREVEQQLFVNRLPPVNGIYSIIHN